LVKPGIYTIDDLFSNQPHLTKVEFTHKKGLDRTGVKSL